MYIGLCSERSRAKINLEELLFQEEVMWRQKSKALWAKEGDNNTRMFHSIVNGRKNRNMIKKLESLEGNIIEGDAGIEAEIIRYFSVLYSDGGVSRPFIEGLNWVPIKEEQANWLERRFDEDEIKKAVFECCPDKAPGPDGFSLVFFRVVGIQSKKM